MAGVAGVGVVVGGALLGDELQRRREEIARATRLAEVQRSELLKMERRRRRRTREAARATASRGFGHELLNRMEK